MDRFLKVFCVVFRLKIEFHLHTRNLYASGVSAVTSKRRPPVSAPQLVFEVLRWGFDGRVAIDDVALLERPCRGPRLCSFEGQVCGYTSSGVARRTQRNGHAAASTGGPKTDHTTETEMGEE